jgi:hypothetical protein
MPEARYESVFRANDRDAADVTGNLLSPTQRLNEL